MHRLWEPLAEKQRPTTPYGAKFSLPYCIALVLVEGAAGVDGFSEAKTRDPRILAVAEKVRYVLDPTLPYPRRFTGHVRVELGDGRVLEETQDAPRGGPEHPLAPEELRAKFRANAARALPAAQVDLLLERLLAIDRARGCRADRRGASGARREAMNGHERRRTMTQRRLWAVLAGLGLALGLWARAEAADPAVMEAAKKEGKVVWYSSLGLSVAQKVCDAFNKKALGITCELARDGSQRIFQKVMQEASAGLAIADVVHTSDISHYLDFQQKGMLMRYLPGRRGQVPAPTSATGTGSTRSCAARPT